MFSIPQRAFSGHAGHRLDEYNNNLVSIMYMFLHEARLDRESINLNFTSTAINTEYLLPELNDSAALWGWEGGWVRLT